MSKRLEKHATQIAIEMSKPSKPFSPMLAAKATLADIKKGMMISPKIDGVRAINVNGVLQTRSGKPIANQYIQQLLSDPLLSGFDGELVIGSTTAPNVCRTTVSALASIEGKPNYTWYVFDDMTDPSDGYCSRYMNARLRIAALNAHHALFNIQALESFPAIGVYTPEYLEERFLAEGYEGIIARAFHAPYKYGRSTLKEGGLLKIKRFSDSEALIIDCIELRREDGSNGNVLGALVCLDTETNCRFNIGTGFNAEQRTAFWQQRELLIGQLATYRYFNSGGKDAPRFPVFHSLRMDLNPPDSQLLN